MAYGCTVVSSTTVSRLARLVTGPLLTASVLWVSSNSQPALPMRWRQRTKLDGSQGSLCWILPLAAEVLPVRVLAPALDGVFVAQREDVLEIDQRGHQPRGQ